MQHDISEVIAYGKFAQPLATDLGLRESCVRAGLDMRALDRRYRMACAIQIANAEGLPANAMIARVIDACSPLDEAEDHLLGEYLIEAGTGSFMARAKISSMVSSSQRGAWAIKRIQHKDSRVSFEACMSTGAGKTFSGVGGVGEAFVERPTFKHVFTKMLVNEAIQLDREIKIEIERQFNVRLVAERNINPGVTIKGISLPNHPGVTSVLVESVRADGMVDVQCIRPGSRHRVKCVFPASALVGVAL